MWDWLSQFSKHAGRFDESDFSMPNLGIARHFPAFHAIAFVGMIFFMILAFHLFDSVFSETEADRFNQRKLQLLQADCKQWEGVYDADKGCMIPKAPQWVVAYCASMQKVPTRRYIGEKYWCISPY